MIYLWLILIITLLLDILAVISNSKECLIVGGLIFIVGFAAILINMMY